MPRLYPIRVITSVVLCACLLMGVSIMVGQHDMGTMREQSSATIHRLESQADTEGMTVAPRTPVLPSKVQRNLLREKTEDSPVTTPPFVLPTDPRVFPKNNIRHGIEEEANNTKITIPDPPMESEVVKTVVTYKMRGDKIIRIIKKYVRKRPKPPPAVDSGGQLKLDKPELKNNSDIRTSGSIAVNESKTAGSEKRIHSRAADSAKSNMLSSDVPADTPREANGPNQNLQNGAADGARLGQKENNGDKRTEELKKTNEELRPIAEGNVPNANDKGDEHKDDHEEAEDPCKPKDEDYERDITTIVTYAKKGTKTIKIIKKIIRKRLKPKRVWEETNNGTEKNNLPEYEQYDQEQIQDQIDFKIDNRCNNKRGFTQRFQEEVAEIEEEMEVGSVNRTSRSHKRMTKKDLAVKYILPEVLKFATGNRSSWTFDYKALAQKRFDLEKTCNARNHFFVTKKNLPLGSALRYDVSNTTVKVNNTLFDTFATAIPFADKMFPRCAVVGSSGILMNSRCGEEIDSSDFVIRFNMAPVGGRFRADVGSKVDIVTVNGDSIRSRYDKLETNISRTMFTTYVRQYNQNTLLWSVPFTSDTHTAYVLRTYQVLKKAGAPQAVVFANPGYMACTNTYWRQRGFTRAPRLSTGMFLTSAALQFCEEVYLYGFWPFPVDTAGNVLPYHYYSKGQRGRLNKWHKMDDEYVNLMDLHKKGILHLQTDKCRYS
ncbi:uncharacterized protein [Branchiostoma lanceolatum]|uniref:uncharacterized protein n=1 Tax=Branchiostoma lanceolatum TaxID=7740 RepID=UPI003453AA0E